MKITREEQEKTKCDYQTEIRFVRLHSGEWLASDNGVFESDEVLTNDVVEHVFANLPWASEFDYVTVKVKDKKGE